MKRRTFLSVAAGAFIAAQTWVRRVWSAVNERDISVDYTTKPGKTTGMSISDVCKILDEGEKNNIPPVLREEILDNPEAVFIIYPEIKTEKDENGRLKPVPDQMERFGRRVSELVFRKGTEKRGRTYINPNMVSLGGKVTDCYGGIVHPYFTVGMVDGLRNIGNNNVAAGMRGAVKREHVVASGFQELLDAHHLPLIDANIMNFSDYSPSDLIWNENPEGIVARRSPTYKPAFQKGTTFINVAHANNQWCAQLSLTVKNLMGIMPNVYGHICDSWCTLDIWHPGIMNDFNPDFRSLIEKSFVKHGNMGYKHWDSGGFYKEYKAKGGYNEFMKVHDDYLKRYRNTETFTVNLLTKEGIDYRKATGITEEQKKALYKIYDFADNRIFWEEQWAQRMCDCLQGMPEPSVNMVEGVFKDRDVLNLFTVGRSRVSVDAVTCWLMGHDPREMPSLRIFNERGLGNNDIEKIPVYTLDEKGVKKVNDYRDLKRASIDIYDYERNIKRM
ncbi:DUF362 domain-containing protein [bacterium]|nr:DUF362 domain-containing protein [bacterium]